MKMKRVLGAVLLLLMVMTLLCGPALAATTQGRKAFDSSGDESGRYTAMSAAGYVINNGNGTTGIELRGSSYNMSDTFLASTSISRAGVGKNTSYFSNTPYSTTYYTRVLSTDTTGYIAVYVA